jgi:hypothetical protein
MEENNNISYEPKTVKVFPGQRSTVKAKIIRSTCGLNQIVATAPNWKPLKVSIDSGFRAELLATLPREIETATINSFVVQFIDANNSPVAIETPASIRLEATSAEIRYGNLPFRNVQEIDLDLGATSTPAIEIRPSSSSSGSGLLRAQIIINKKINQPQTVFSQATEFRIIPSWWLALLVASFGGILYSLYNLTKSLPRPQKITNKRLAGIIASNVLGGVLAGCLAYFLASWNILGIKVDTTSLRGFALLGFLFAYIGVDSIMKRTAGSPTPSPPS